MTDFTFTRGDTKTFTFQSTDNLPNGTTQPTDLTAYQAIWFTAKKAVTDADGSAVMQKTLGGGIVIDSVDHSKAHITINPADTANLTITGQSLTLLYDLQTKDAGGNINTPQSGSILLSPDITLSR